MLPPQYYKNFAIRSPIQTHTRPATCVEIGCLAYHNGWQYRIETLLPEDLHVAIHSGKRCRIVDVKEGESYLVFEPGQPCFDAPNHRVTLDRPEIFLVGRGHYSQFQAKTARRHANGENFMDDMINHLDVIVTEIKRGSYDG